MPAKPPCPIRRAGGRPVERRRRQRADQTLAGLSRRRSPGDSGLHLDQRAGRSGHQEAGTRRRAARRDCFDARGRQPALVETRARNQDFDLAYVSHTTLKTTCTGWAACSIARRRVAAGGTSWATSRPAAIRNRTTTTCASRSTRSAPAAISTTPRKKLGKSTPSSSAGCRSSRSGNSTAT